MTTTTNTLAVANTILEQLGGRRFQVMTGAKDFLGDATSLRFRLPSNFATDGINHVKITLEASDTYTMEFYKVRGTKVVLMQTRYFVYDDQLRGTFSAVTGLDTSL